MLGSNLKNTPEEEYPAPDPFPPPGEVPVLGVVYGRITVADITIIIITYVCIRINITYVSVYRLK
jgi:hypothetical protein